MEDVFDPSTKPNRLYGELEALSTEGGLVDVFDALQKSVVDCFGGEVDVK